MTTESSTSQIPEWELADRIRKARRHAGLTQAELAERMGLKTQTLGNWEAGTAAPRDVVGTAERIAEATQVPVHWLLGLDIPQGARSRCFSDHDPLQWVA